MSASIPHIWTEFQQTFSEFELNLSKHSLNLNWMSEGIPWIWTECQHSLNLNWLSAFPEFELNVRNNSLNLNWIRVNIFWIWTECQQAFPELNLLLVSFLSPVWIWYCSIWYSLPNLELCSFPNSLLTLFVLGFLPCIQTVRYDCM